MRTGICLDTLLLHYCTLARVRVRVSAVCNCIFVDGGGGTLCAGPGSGPGRGVGTVDASSSLDGVKSRLSKMWESSKLALGFFAKKAPAAGPPPTGAGSLMDVTATSRSMAAAGGGGSGASGPVRSSGKADPSSGELWLLTWSYLGIFCLQVPRTLWSWLVFFLSQLVGGGWRGWHL